VESADAVLVLQAVVFAEMLHSSVDTVRNDVRCEISVKGICSVSTLLFS